jgi:hypothetical protein
MKFSRALALPPYCALIRARLGKDLNIGVIHVQDEQPALVLCDRNRTGEKELIVGPCLPHGLPRRIMQRRGLTANAHLTLAAEAEREDYRQSWSLHVSTS